MARFYKSCAVAPIQEQIRNLAEGSYFTWNKCTFCLLHHEPGGALCSKIGEPVPRYFSASIWCYRVSHKLN